MRRPKNLIYAIGRGWSPLTPKEAPRKKKSNHPVRPWWLLQYSSHAPRHTLRHALRQWTKKAAQDSNLLANAVWGIRTPAPVQDTKYKIVIYYHAQRQPVRQIQTEWMPPTQRTDDATRYLSKYETSLVHQQARHQTECHRTVSVTNQPHHLCYTTDSWIGP